MGVGTTLLFACLVALVAASPSGFFSDADRNNVKSLLLSSQGSNGAFEGSIEATADSVAALISLSTDVPKKTEVCAYAKSFLTGDASVADIHSAVFVLETLKCGEQVSKAVDDKLKKALADDGNLLDYYHVGSAVALLLDGKHTSLDKTVLVTAANLIIDLVDEDGSFKASSHEEYGTVASAGYALTFLASIAERNVLSADDKQGLVGVSTKVADLVGSAEGPESGEYLELIDVDTEASLLPTAMIVEASARLAVALKGSWAVKREALPKFAEYLILHKHAASAAEARYLLSALNTVASNAFYTPLVLTVDRSTILTSAKGDDGHVTVSVTDVLGRFATEAKVTLVSAVAEANPEVVLLNNQDVALVAGSTTKYSFNMLVTKPEPGFYFAEFKAVATKEASKFVDVTGAARDIKVITSQLVSDCKVVVSDSIDKISDDDARVRSLAYPAAAEDVFKATSSQHLIMALKVKNAVSKRALHPHQAAIRLSNARGTAAVFHGVWDGKASLHFDVAFAKTAAVFGSASGDYSVEVLLGDAFVSNPIVWKVGTVRLTFTDADGPLASAADSPSPYLPKPAINHVFRAAEKRPALTVSLVFTALTVAPLLVLFVGLVKVGVNLSDFPTGAAFLPAVVFHASIGCIVALYALYFLSLNMFQTLGYLSVLGTVAFFSGQRVLYAKASARVAPSKAHSD